MMSLPLAPYACHPDASRGRVHAEAPSATRDPFHRDRDRIIHSASFRRLKHKTQVFVAGHGDHFRTRLTHSLEVAQIARALARALRVNEDLTESIALAHDLGHPPFAHKGEDVLARLMEPYGGFYHNDQTVRVVTVLEHRYAAFRGLNLSAETLEGLVKHNGPVRGDLPFTIRELANQVDLQLHLWTPLEAQIVDIADDTAYCNHDVEDGLRAGCFTLDDLTELSLYRDVIPDYRQKFAGVPPDVLRAELIRHQIGVMVDDILSTTRANLVALNPQTVDDIRRAGRALVRFSPAMFAQVKELREFLFARMYDAPSQKTLARHAEAVITGLFDRFMQDPGLLPAEWRMDNGEGGLFPPPEGGRVRVGVVNNDTSPPPARFAVHLPPQGGGKNLDPRRIADYIAGMTDGYAEREYERVKGSIYSKS